MHVCVCVHLSARPVGVLCTCALVCLHCVYTVWDVYSTYACGLCVSSWGADFVFGEWSVHEPYIVGRVCVCAVCCVCDLGRDSVFCVHSMNSVWGRERGICW